MYTHAYIHVCIYVCDYVYMCSVVYVCAVYMYMCVCVYVFVCLCMCMSMYMCVYVYMSMCVCIYVCVHACWFVLVVSDSASLWTIAHQTPLSMGFSRQEYWSGLPCPPPGNLPDPVIKPTSLCLLYRQVCSLPLAPPGNPMYTCVYVRIGVHVCVYVHVYMYKCVYMGVCIYAQVCIYVSICYMCMHMCVCMDGCIYVCICVCICMSVFTISIDRSPNHGNTAARLPGWGSRDGMWRVAAVGLELHISVAELCGFLSLGGPWSWPFSPSCRFPGVEAGWTLIKLYLPSPLARQAFLLLRRPDPRPIAHAGHIVTTLQFILHPSLPWPRPSWPDWIPSLLSEHTLSSLCSSPAVGNYIFRYDLIMYSLWHLLFTRV